MILMVSGGTKIIIKTNIGVRIKQEAKLDFSLYFMAHITLYNLINIPQNIL